MSIPAENLIALSKIGDDKKIKEARAGLKPGSYDVDFTVRIYGKMTVAPDTVASVAGSKPSIDESAILGLLLEAMTTGRQFKSTNVTDLILEVQADVDATRKLDPAKIVAATSPIEAANKIYQLKNPPGPAAKVHRAGAVKTMLEYEIGGVTVDRSAPVASAADLLGTL